MVVDQNSVVVLRYKIRSWLLDGKCVESRVCCPLYWAAVQYTGGMYTGFRYFPPTLKKTTSVLPVLHMLHRSFSSNLTCHFLTFFFFCLPPQKGKEQLPYMQSIKIPIPDYLGNTQNTFDVSFCIWWYTGVLSLSFFSLSFSYLYTGKVFSDTSILMHSFLCEPFGCIQEGQLH